MKIWGQAIVTPLIAVVIVAAFIVGIGELLLTLAGSLAVIGAVVLMALIVAAAVVVARRVSATE
ncbi:MAG TPA: hypothetical protein VMU89_22515 [Thermomicrobiaceae bacterium]|nr:hypothetical protein [Thermomicrobiaceae bacterium]